MLNGEKKWKRPWRWHMRMQIRLGAHTPSAEEKVMLANGSQNPDVIFIYEVFIIVNQRRELFCFHSIVLQKYIP